MKKMILAVTVLAFASAALAEEMVENPAYKVWSAFKVGAMVKTETVANTTAGETKMTTKMVSTSTLKELTAEKAVLEVASETSVGGEAMKAPAQKVELPAKVAKTTTQPAHMEKKGEGDEELEAGGKKYKCHWVEMVMKMGDVTTTSKTWTCKDVPGGMVRMQSKTDAPQLKSEMKTELVEAKAGG